MVSLCFSGNSVLVGSLGQQLVSLASFALFLAGYEIQSVDFSKESGFIDGMKSLFRQAGLEGKPIGVIVKVCMHCVETWMSCRTIALYRMPYTEVA